MMKRLFLCFACLLSAATAAFGETKYITDVFEVMVRTAPDEQYRIVAMPQSGTPVEILGTKEAWSNVKLSNDKEGWVQTQYLIPGPPNKQVIAQLRTENIGLTEKATALSEENARLKEERREFEKALNKETQSAATLKQSYESLQSESKEFLALKSDYEKASVELSAKTAKVSELEDQVRSHRKSQALRWFVAGAGVILVGFAMGFISRRPKRRSSLL